MEPDSITLRAGRTSFPRSARLLRATEFAVCLGRGQRLGSAFFRAQVIASERGSRIGFAVSRKVDRRAVVRNRIKRCARQSFRFARAALPSFDIVLTARREAASASLAQLGSDLEELWRRLAALKRGPGAVTMRAATASAAAAASS